jgi:hypothetical protein
MRLIGTNSVCAWYALNGTPSNVLPEDYKYPLIRHDYEKGWQVVRKNHTLATFDKAWKAVVVAWFIGRFGK